MEHFTSLCGVLFDFLGEYSLPNSAELMGLYGRVSNFSSPIPTLFVVVFRCALTVLTFVNKNCKASAPVFIWLPL